MRKPIAKKGDKLVIEDNEEVFVVLSVKPYKRAILSKRMDSYEYEVKPTSKPRSKSLWVDQSHIMGIVTFTPLSFKPFRHFEFAQDLGGYEMLREFVESLPNKKGHNYRVVQLMKLIEQCALLVEGDRQESLDAREEIEDILR